jgi:hypothetical protein
VGDERTHPQLRGTGSGFTVVPLCRHRFLGQVWVNERG